MDHVLGLRAVRVLLGAVVGKADDARGVMLEWRLVRKGEGLGTTSVQVKAVKVDSGARVGVVELDPGREVLLGVRHDFVDDRLRRLLGDGRGRPTVPVLANSKKSENQSRSDDNRDRYEVLLSDVNRLTHGCLPRDLAPRHEGCVGRHVGSCDCPNRLNIGSERSHVNQMTRARPGTRSSPVG
jgi:hypothetical protein